MTSAFRRRRRGGPGRPFQAGEDPRRHQLTREEQSRGGRTTWSRYMRQWRSEVFGAGSPQVEQLGGVH